MAAEGVGGQVTFCRLHLVDFSHYELPWTHEGVEGVGGGVLVVRGRGGIGGPVLEEHLPSSRSQRLVGFSHEIRWGNICPMWGRSV